MVGHTWAVDVQNRGFRVQHCDKPQSPEDVDMRICAELPSSHDPEQSELLRIRLSSQIHGPCGVRNPHAPYMEDGCCAKKFTNDFEETTELHSNGYPRYRRRETSPRVVKG